MGKIIAVANQKGGVGKTTTAVNLSAAMGERGHKTLLVDIDPQGNASSGVGIDRRSVPKSTYELLIGEAGAKEALVQTQFPNLTILPSSLNLAGAELELVDFDHREALSLIHISQESRRRWPPPVWAVKPPCLLLIWMRWGIAPAIRLLEAPLRDTWCGKSTPWAEKWEKPRISACCKCGCSTGERARRSTLCGRRSTGENTARL